jgi:Ca2+-dependent lipid-binding protein
MNEMKADKKTIQPNEDEKRAQSDCENQQMLIYLFVSLMLIGCWILGLLGASFFWVFGVMVLTFAVWRSKVMVLLERQLKQQELMVHRRRALRQSETTEWLNFIINRW